MSQTAPRVPVLVIGVGAIERGDDAVGRLVAREIAGQRPDAPFKVIQMRGEATDLMDAWSHARAVILIDAASTGAPPGTTHRFDASCGPLPAEMARASTHDLGVSDAIELARAMAALPRHVIVYAIDIGQATHGSALSPAVQAAVGPTAERVIREAEQLTQGATRHA